MIRFVLFAALLAALPFLGCGGSDSDTNALLVGNKDEPESLDPHLATSTYSARILNTLFEGLVTLDPETLEPVPGVAESWDITEDGLTYTFHLRDDARWSNGDPVTSGDFMYSWRRMLTPTLASQYSYMLHVVENAEAYNAGRIDDFSEVGFNAPDPHTVIVKLAYPAPCFLTMHGHQSWFPVHQATIEKFGAIDSRDTKWVRAGNLVGNGPYALTEWRPNSYLEVRRNEHYWNNAKTTTEAVRFLPVDSENTEERMFRAGEIHITESMPLPKVNTWRDENPDMLRIDPQATTSYAYFNTERKPFDDPRVRRAFSMALNRQAIVDSVRNGVDKPAYAFSPEGIGGYTSPAQVEEDYDEARRLLAEAGYPGGEGMPAIELLYSTSDLGKYLTEVMQQMWQENLGVRVNISNQEWKVFLSTTDQHNYDIAVMSWAADYLDPVNFLELFTTENGNNRTGYSSAEYDALIEQGRTTNDRAERYRLFGEAESILLKDAPLAPVYNKSRSFLCRPEVQNFPANLMDYRRFDRMVFAGE